MNLIDSKSLLAKLMATENLTVEQKNVRTASFDVKNRILTVPKLDEKISSQLYDLFMGHEVGHALYTPFDGMMDAINKKMNMSLINVIEDSRIERKIKNKYPGLKNSFLRAYQELMARDFFETQGKNLNRMNFIDRLNLYSKGGVSLNIQFNDIEKDLIRQVEDTDTYDDVIEVYHKIFSYMKMEEEQKQQMRMFSKDETDDEDGDEYELDDPDYDENGESYSGDSENYDDEEPLEDNDEGYEFGAGKHNVEEEIRSHTDEAFRRNESQLFANKDSEYLYLNVPKLNPNEYILDYKDLYSRYEREGHESEIESFNAYRRESNKVVSYLVKEFEMRKNADQMKRASTSKTGDLNLNKIFSYKFSEDIFKKITVVPGGKSHGLVMFIDWSGSMANHISNTVKQLFNLVLFCKKVNIPFEVYAFSDSSELRLKSMRVQKAKPKDFFIPTFALLNILSSRMSAKELTYAGGALLNVTGERRYRCPDWMRLGGTPLNETVVLAMELVPAFQKKYKLQVVNTVFLTDGDGSPIQVFFDENCRHESVRFMKRPDGSVGRITDVVLVDPVTKMQEKYRAHGSSFNELNALIRLFKYRTKSNVIGFYITTPRELTSNMYKFFKNADYESVEKIKTDFRKHKFVISNQTSFDDYYVLRSTALDTEEDAQLIVKENATTRGLVSAFTKYAGARVNNRVILNRFIGLIS